MDKKKKTPVPLDSESKLTGRPTSGDWTPESISFYFDKALTVLNNENYTTSKEYIDLLVNQCLAEKNWSEGFTYFLTKVNEFGLQIETDQDTYTKLSEKLFFLRTTRMLVNAAGLGPYEQEIMKYEIAKYYQPINPMPTLPPVKQETPYVRPPRRPAEPKRDSIFLPKAKPPTPAAAPRPKPKPKAGPPSGRKK